jgi:hypothetical protein
MVQFGRSMLDAASSGVLGAELPEEPLSTYETISQLIEASFLLEKSTEISKAFFGPLYCILTMQQCHGWGLPAKGTKPVSSRVPT